MIFSAGSQLPRPREEIYMLLLFYTTNNQRMFDREGIGYHSHILQLWAGERPQHRLGTAGCTLHQTYSDVENPSGWGHGVVD